LQVTNRVGIGGASNTQKALWIQTPTMIGTTQWGIDIAITYSAAATTAGNALAVSHSTGGNGGTPYTIGGVRGVTINNVSKHADTTITTLAGIYIYSQTSGGTNNFGLYIEAPSGGSGSNVGLRNEGTTTLIGKVTIVPSGTASTAGDCLNFPNNKSIAWRNAANNADIQMFVNGSDQFRFQSAMLIDGATTMSAALTVNASGSVFSAGTDASTNLTLGSGGAAPTAVRTHVLAIDAPHSVTYVGSAALDFKRAGAIVWEIGINTATSAPKTANTDLYFYSSAYVASLSTAGALTLAAGLTATTGAFGDAVVISKSALAQLFVLDNTAADAGVTNAAYSLFRTGGTPRYYLGISVDGANGGFGLYNSAVSAIAWRVDKTNAMIIVGVVGVGGATPSASTALIHPAATTALSSARFPHGVAPTTPVDGDFWTTTSGAFVRINGVTKTFTLS